MKKKSLLVLSLFVLVFAGFTQAAYAVLQEPTPKAGDRRLRTYSYGPDQVYIFRGHYKYQSRIDLDPKENIQNISIGDSTGWMISPVGNRIFLKPIQQDATTNMTIITDKRIYNFELYAEEAKDIRDEGLVWSASFIYNDGGDNSEGGSFIQVNNPKKDLPSQKELAKNPQKYNFKYTLTGSKEFSPLEVFDDGEFTFFKFKDINAELPAFFQVMADGNEALINYRKTGDYVVIEMVTSQFTLRHGIQTVCVFNEARPLEKLSEEQIKKMKEKQKGDQKIFGIF